MSWNTQNPAHRWPAMLTHMLFWVADTRLYTLPCRLVSVGRSEGRYVQNIFELRAVFALRPLSNRPRLYCRVSGLVKNHMAILTVRIYIMLYEAYTCFSINHNLRIKTLIQNCPSCQPQTISMIAFFFIQNVQKTHYKDELNPDSDPNTSFMVLTLKPFDQRENAPCASYATHATSQSIDST